MVHQFPSTHEALVDQLHELMQDRSELHLIPEDEINSIYTPFHGLPLIFDADGTWLRVGTIRSDGEEIVLIGYRTLGCSFIKVDPESVDTHVLMHVIDMATKV